MKKSHYVIQKSHCGEVCVVCKKGCTKIEREQATEWSLSQLLPTSPTVLWPLRPSCLYQHDTSPDLDFFFFFLTGATRAVTTHWVNTAFNSRVHVFVYKQNKKWTHDRLECFKNSIEDLLAISFYSHLAILLYRALQSEGQRFDSQLYWPTFLGNTLYPKLLIKLRDSRCPLRAGSKDSDDLKRQIWGLIKQTHRLLLHSLGTAKSGKI